MASMENEFGQPLGEPVPGWQPVPLPPRTPMAGRFCRVEPVELERHAAELFEAFTEDREGRNWTYMSYGPFADAAGFEAWMRRTCLGDDPLFHTIVERRTGRAVGLASYLRIEPAFGVVEVGHLSFSPRLQRTPAATEAMVLMMRRVFVELGYRRYEWKCHALNAASRRAAERLGFRFEGIFRQATISKGRNRDTAWYSIIDKEWPTLQRAFVAWLDPANFDEAGQQRKSLAQSR